MRPFFEGCPPKFSPFNLTSRWCSQQPWRSSPSLPSPVSIFPGLLLRCNGSFLTAQCYRERVRFSPVLSVCLGLKYLHDQPQYTIHHSYRVDRFTLNQSLRCACSKQSSTDNLSEPSQISVNHFHYVILLLGRRRTSTRYTTKY